MHIDSKEENPPSNKEKQTPKAVKFKLTKFQTALVEQGENHPFLNQKRGKKDKARRMSIFDEISKKLLKRNTLQPIQTMVGGRTYELPCITCSDIYSE